MVQDLYKQKRSLELRWQLEYEQNGKYTLNMVRIDRKVKEVLTHIRAAEAQKAHLENKVEDAAPQVSVAT